jgi:glutathione S-transferase
MTRYTLVVGTRNWSSWSLRPFVALKATGAPYEIIDIRLRRFESPTTREQILKHSPAGKVPVLKIHEGENTLIVWDSLAICEALAERHPEAGLWPKDLNTRAIARSYCSEMHSGFPDLREQLSMDFVRKKALPELRDDTKIQIARILSAWDSALEKYKGEFLFGNLCVADCMYAPVVSRFRTFGVETSKPVAAYMDRVMALPAMREWMKASQAEVDAGLPLTMPPLR